MAARPNTRRTLEYGQRIATNHLVRLEEAIAMAENVIAENPLLSREDVNAYQECISTARKQRTQYRKIAELPIPTVDTATTRHKRGRPSKAELDAIAAERNGTAKPKRRGRPPKAKAAPAVPAKKRRGRPPKVKTEAVAKAAAPVKKRRGRPPKVKTEEVVAAAPKKRRGRPPKVKTEEVSPVKKRRGRPPKVKEPMTATEGAPVKRKRGRPKGSKNKTKATAS